MSVHIVQYFLEIIVNVGGKFRDRAALIQGFPDSFGTGPSRRGSEASGISGDLQAIASGVGEIAASADDDEFAADMLLPDLALVQGGHARHPDVCNDKIRLLCHDCGQLLRRTEGVNNLKSHII
ncbi:MAG: hypothetical protein ACLVJO_05850 [[Clostridium] scindens]